MLKISKKRIKIYFTLVVLNILVVVSIFTLNIFENKFLFHNKNLSYKIMKIKFLTSQYHLWIEEYLNGDKKEYPKINLSINKSLEELNSLLKISKNNATIKSELIKINDLIKQIIKLQEYRFKSKNTLEIDYFFDKSYQDILNNLNNIDKILNKDFKEKYSIYNFIKYILYFSIITLVFIGVYLLFRLNKDIQEKNTLSYIDELTKAKNVKFYKKMIKELFDEYEESDTTFSIIMFDIDNFKKINDTYGHKKGDEVLINLANTISSNIRKNVDSFFRVGGEEFIVLCPNTSLDIGIKIAEKLRLNIFNDLNVIENEKITVSLGVCEVDKKDNINSIYERVDKKLYHSKNNGKNRVSY